MNIKRSVFSSICTITLIVFLYANSLAQEHPPVINYPPHVYNADNQNWMLTQAPDRTIYAANNKGLLAFNGSQWTLYPSPNETVMRGAKAVGDRIYTGAYMDFGIWERDRTGVLKYTSISSLKKVQMIEDEHIWNIEQYKQYILFQSLDRIYIYDTQKEHIQAITPDGQVVRLFLVGDEFFFQVRGQGVYTIVNGAAVPYNGSNLFKENSLINVFNIGGQYIGVTATKGLYVFDDVKTIPWDTFDNQLISEVNIYSAIRRSNGSIVLGTIENGVIQFSKEGELDYKIKKGNGLNNNTALALLEDKDQNLWVGLDAGIDCVNKFGPFSQYIDLKGTLGTIYAAAVSDGYLYLGTNQGLFFKRENTTAPFMRMEGMEGQVWDLSKINNTLFCGHNSGTFSITKENSRRISSVDGTWDIKKIPGQPNLLLQGNYNGLHVLEKKQGQWQLRNKIENFVHSSKHFEFVDTHTLLVSHEYKGVYEIRLDSLLYAANQVFKHNTASIGEHSSLSRLGEDVFYANNDGILRYSPEEHQFIRDDRLSTLFTKETFVTGKLIEDDQWLWAFTQDNLVRISRDKLDGEYVMDRISLPSAYRNTVEGYEIFVRFRESEYLLGTSNGYIIVDTEYFSDKDYEISLNQGAVRNLSGEEQLISVLEEGDFSSEFNNVRFTYSVPEYDKFLTTQYAYQLDGLYDKWSSWNSSSSASFENLPYGDYTFRVKASINNKETVNAANFKFTIARPWYWSTLAIVLYIVLIIALFTVLNWFYKRYYRKQQELALDRSKRDMELKALENEKQIIQLNNANLKQDIDARNRELAVSTMNMVNKNKTLNTIKNALLKASKLADIEDIIEIVDQTIENQEDWNFFEKAFNHADKDFFTKVKQEHPSLTANDLKLCVYLRLNMSSKEIAPLLNISSRSVEIKRYRLRKKLDLSREINLNDYFINL